MNDRDMADDLARDFFLGFIKVHILHHAGEGPVYGLEMIEELRRHGYQLSPGTLYPVLHSLERAGYLRREGQVVHGKVRKYYYLSDAGRSVLESAKRSIRELVNEVLCEDAQGSTALPEEVAHHGR